MMVLQDALDGLAPTVAMTLTTARATTPPEVFRRDVEQVFRAIRRRCPDAEYLGRIEFTTGKGARSGGHRRIHQHMLLKGVTVNEASGIEADVIDVWKQRTGAHRVELARLRSAAGAAHYLTHHHSKADQAPSKGWQGRRLRASRGYFGRPADVRRAQAKEVLRDRSVVKDLIRLLDDQGLDPAFLGPDWDELLADSLERAAERAMKTELVLVADLPTAYGEDGLPSEWSREVVGPVHV